MRKIYIANDHAATDMKKDIVKYLEEKGYEVVNFGTDENSSVDYPEYAKKVGEAVKSDENSLGILICGTGVGMSIAANKIKGVRAAAVSESYSARLTRMHNNANVICFGARVVGIEIAKTIVDAFVETQYEGERHARRVEMIKNLEEEN